MEKQELFDHNSGLFKKQLHFNKPQLRSYLIRAHEEYAVWGRGTGKSEGLIAPRSVHNIHTMPRSSGIFVGATYLQILDRTLPAVMAGWARMGYIHGVHYWVRKRPPKGVPTPLYEPQTPEYCIYWYNGTVIRLVSQDRPGSSNGLSIDWIIGDEAKLLNKKKLDEELLPTNRGNTQHFGNLPEHHSLLFCTDMPTSVEAKWILDKENEVDQEQISLMLSLQVEIINLKKKLKEQGNTSKRLVDQIRKYEKLLTEVRFESVYFSDASTLDNIEALGVKFIRQMKRTLPKLVFDTAILNKRIITVDNGFYPHLDVDVHTYESIDYDYVDGLELYLPKGIINDCRKDADLLKNKPIDVALDYGSSINWCVIGQDHPYVYKYLNALFVKHPKRLRDLAKDFNEYYKYHRCKVVNYYFDHTAVGTNATDNFNYAQVWIDELTEYGWTVNEYYIGQAPGHQWKYELFGRLHMEDDPTIKRVRYNKSNCKFLLISMQQAKLRQGSKGFEKDKRDEGKTYIDQAETTHGSDAGDTLYIGKFAEHLGIKDPELDAMMI